LTWIKVGVNRFDHASFSSGRLAMSTETAIVVAAIVLVFTGFALTLSWAERQTRGIQGRDENAPDLALSSSKAREPVAA
jgi:hypothetical protein